jgi:hypothetical protein
VIVAVAETDPGIKHGGAVFRRGLHEQSWSEGRIDIAGQALMSAASEFLKDDSDEQENHAE